MGDVRVGANPLVRRSDRAEAWLWAWVFGALIVVSMAAGAVGSAWFDVGRAARGEQVTERHLVTARVVETGVRVDRWRARVWAVWEDAGSRHVQDVEWTGPADAGDTVSIWVGIDGRYTGPPDTMEQLTVEAFVAGTAVWTIVVAAWTVVALGVQGVIDVERRQTWESRLAVLLTDRGRRDNSA